VSLFKPRATLGQRQFLIKPRTQFSGKITLPQYKKIKQDATHPGGGLTPRRDWAAGLFPASSGCTDPTDADAGRTDDSVDPARRNDRTPRGRSSRRRRRRQRPRRRSLTLPLALQPLLDDSVDTTPLQTDGPGSASSSGPFDSRQPRSGWLSSRSRRQRRHVSNAGPRQ